VIIDAKEGRMIKSKDEPQAESSEGDHD